MVAFRDFTHGADFAARISAVGFHWSSVGENIATGFTHPGGSRSRLDGQPGPLPEHPRPQPTATSAPA